MISGYISDACRFLLRVTASVTEASGNLDRIMANALSVRPTGGLVHQGYRRPGSVAGIVHSGNFVLPGLAFCSI